MAQSNWEADKMLDVYLVKKKLHNTAKSFMTEGKVSPDPVAIDAPGGFLFEWWSVFWDIFIARTNEKHSEAAAAYIEAQQGKEKKQQLQMQQMQMIRQAQMQRGNSNHPSLGGPNPMNGIGSEAMLEAMLGQSNASQVAAKIYEECMKQPNQMNTETSQPHMDARMALLKSGANHHGNFNHCCEVSSIRRSASKVICCSFSSDGKLLASSGHDKKVFIWNMETLHTESTPEEHGHIITDVRFRPNTTQLATSSFDKTIKIWDASDQMQMIRQAQMQRGNPNHPSLWAPMNGVGYEAMLGQSNASQEQTIMVKWSKETIKEVFQQHCCNSNHEVSRPLIESNLGASPRQLPVDPSTVYGQGILQSKPGMGNAGHLDNSTRFRPSSSESFPSKSKSISALATAATTATDLGSGLPRGNLNSKDGQQNANDGSIGSPMQSSSSKHINMPPVQQSSSQQQDPLLSQQSQQYRDRKHGRPIQLTTSTPSTHTPVDGVAIAGNMQHVNNMSKGPMMYGSDGISGLASSANQLLQDDMEPFGDVGALEDNVESFLSQDDGDGGSIFSTLKRNPSEHAETSKVFSFSEVSSIRRSASKVICCSFSSDGKLLASAGHDKKVFIWNMETLHTESTPEEHGHIITDVRFRPNTTQLATSSFYKTIKIWDALILVTSDEPFLVGASTQARFQPISGKFLAAASDNSVSLVDVEKDIRVHLFKGHSSNVNSVCWNTSGELLASVSENSIKLWSPSSGDCIHDLSFSGNKSTLAFFTLAIPISWSIGGYQSLELWNTKENKCMTIPAHECVISALAQSPSTGMMASAK
ncbi:hypothetical protein Bca101_039966 [Brassica carinata]